MRKKRHPPPPPAQLVPSDPLAPAEQRPLALTTAVHAESAADALVGRDASSLEFLS